MSGRGKGGKRLEKAESNIILKSHDNSQGITVPSMRLFHVVECANLSIRDMIIISKLSKGWYSISKLLVETRA